MSGGADPSFGNDGRLSLADHHQCFAAVVQGDGKIVFTESAANAGTFSFGVSRLNPDGSPDLSFGAGGSVQLNFTHLDYPAALALDSNGRILVGGTSDITGSTGSMTGSEISLARLEPDGTPDPTFGDAGKVVLSPTPQAEFSTLLITGQSILVGGYADGLVSDRHSLLARLRSDGSLDPSFGAGGVVTLSQDVTEGLAVDTAGRIIGCGQQWNGVTHLIVSRFNPDGSADDSFGIGGSVFSQDEISFGGRVLARPDGSIVALAEKSHFYSFTDIRSTVWLTAFSSDGSPDTAFGTGGSLDTGIEVNGGGLTVSRLADGKLLIATAAGSTLARLWTVVRLTPDGQADPTFGGGGRLGVSFADLPSSVSDTVTSLSVLSDGKYLLCGFGTQAEFARVDPAATPSLPRAAFSAPATIPEGFAPQLTGTGTTSEPADPIVAYEWDPNYDGVQFHPAASGSTFSAGNLDGPSTRAIALRVTDSFGGQDIKTATLSVTNVAPTARFAVSGVVSEGTAGSASFAAPVDPSSADVAAGFRYSFDFDNDGVFEILDSTSPNAVVPASYLATPGFHNVAGRISDKDGGSTLYTGSIDVVPPTGSVMGLVFVDANHDGVRQSTESGLSGATVYLDLNDNATPDPGEPRSTTSSGGTYSFSSYPVGDYTVRQLVPSGYRLTAPLSYFGDVTVINASTVTGPTFGDVRVSTVPMDFNYLLTLAQHYGQQGTFATGDLNGDDTVNFSDLLLLAQNYGHPLAAAGATADASDLTLLKRLKSRTRVGR